LQQQVWFNYAIIGLTVFRSVGAALLVAFVRPTTEAFFQWPLLATVLTLVVLGWRLYAVLPAATRPAQFSMPALTGIGRFALGMLGINILAVMLLQLDKLLLSRLISLEALGHYLLAAAVAAVINALTTPVTQALSPSLVAAVTTGDTARQAQLYHGGAQLISVLVAPVAMMMIFFGEDAVGIWTGDGALAIKVAPLLALLALGTFLNGLMHMSYFAMSANGWTRLSLGSNILAVVVMVVLLLLLVPEWGGRGAATAWVLVNLGVLLFQAPLVHRRILKGELAGWYLRDVAAPLLAAALGVGAVVWLRQSVVINGRPAVAGVLALGWLSGTLLAALAAGEVRRMLAKLVRRR
jgi:O-antigen/teichoic acid export membrane protein